MRSFSVAYPIVFIFLLPSLVLTQPTKDLAIEKMKAENRVALVIGNGTYQYAALQHPPREAHLTG